MTRWDQSDDWHFNPKRQKTSTAYAIGIDVCPKCGRPGKLHATRKMLRIKRGRKSRNHPWAKTMANQTIWTGLYGEVVHSSRCYIGKIPNVEVDPKTGQLINLRRSRNTEATSEPSRDTPLGGLTDIEA